MPKNIINAPPDAGRLIEGMRDTGYTAVTALCDVIDNSIAAEATKINVDFFVHERREPFVELFIADNGIGIDADSITNAMTYGSTERTDEESLGKFGLGLKTASTAMCRQLTLVSKSRSSSDIHARRWNLDFVSERGSWDLIEPEESEVPEEIQKLENVLGFTNKPVMGNILSAQYSSTKIGKKIGHSMWDSGTVVSWSKIDRLIPRQSQSVDTLKKQVERLEREFTAAIARTYHKFLSGEESARVLEIRVNGQLVHPWDPFGRDLGSEQKVNQSLEVEFYNSKTQTLESADLAIRSYILPPSSDLSEAQQRYLAVGERQLKLLSPHGTAFDNQGIFVYRHNRLIARGDWLDVRRKEQHLNLARVEVSFDQRLDSAFKLDVKKSQIIIDAALRDEIGILLRPTIMGADKTYRENQKSKTLSSGSNLNDTANKVIAKVESDITKDIKLIEQDNDEAEIENASGRPMVRVKTVNDVSQPFVLNVGSVPNGFLWEPGSNQGKPAVRLNPDHEFFKKALAIDTSGPAANQSLKYVLWALVVAELKSMDGDMRTEKIMKKLREDVSNTLTEIAGSMPEQTQ